MTDHHHDHQDHPLTDKFLAENYSPFFVIDIEEFVYCSRDMRAVYDKGGEDMLEQVLKFMEENGFGIRKILLLKDAMRPQQQEDN